MVPTVNMGTTMPTITITYSTHCNSTIGPTDSFDLLEYPDSREEVITVTGYEYEIEEVEREPEPVPKCRKKKEAELKSRAFVKIHNPPGGWGFGRF